MSAPAPKEVEPATCKELVELLQAKGMDVVWYDQGTLYQYPGITIRHKGQVQFKEYATVIQYPTPASAREHAGTNPVAFSYGRFAVFGEPKLVEEIKDHLR